MAGFRFDTFKGIRPRVQARLLPRGEANTAENIRFGAGDIQPWDGLTSVATGASTTLLSIFRMHNNGSPIWLQSTNDVEYARGPAADDTLERIYYTGEAQPRFTFTTIVQGTGLPPDTGYRYLGIPAPTAAATVAADRDIYDNVGSNLMIAVASSGSGNRAMRSTDGITWEGLTPPDHDYRGIAYSPDLSMWGMVESSGVSSQFVYSLDDGDTWNTQALPTSDNWWDIVWAGGTIQLWVIVGNGSTIMTSPDGTSWTNRTAPGGHNYFGVAYDDTNDVLVAVGGTSASAGYIARSTNGTTWTNAISYDSTAWWQDVTWAGGLGLFVATASSGADYATSPDGDTWTARTGVGDANNIAWSEDLTLLVATGNTGTITTSPDGITWTARSTPAGPTSYAIADNVLWNPAAGKFVGVADASSGDFVITSSDGITWTTESATAGLQWQAIAQAAGAGTTATFENEPRVYVYTYVSDIGEEGPPSDASAVINVVTEEDNEATVTINGFATPPSTQQNITDIRIYRSATGTGITEFFFVAEITVAAGTYDDSLTDLELGEVLQTESWEPPAATLEGIIALPNGMMAGFTGKTVHFSEPYYPHAWPPEYKQTVAHEIVGLGALPNGVAVLTKGTPYAIVGDHPRGMSQTHYQFNQACVSKRSIVSTINSVIYASPDGLCEIGARGFSILTRAFAQKDEWQTFNPATITAFWHDSKYFGFYDTGTLIFDPHDESIGLSTCTQVALGGHLETEDDILYLIIDGGGGNDTIESWDTNAAAPLTLTWKTGRLVAPYPMNLGAARIIATTYPVTLDVWNDEGDNIVAARSVTSDEAIRLPGGYLSDWYEIQVSNDDGVQMVHLAETVEELEQG